MNRNKKIALAKHLDMKLSDLYKEHEDYLVLTDSEADEACKDAILDSVWAFRPEFLAAHAVDGVDAETIKSIQANNKCEENNVVLLRLIDDVDHFVQDSIACDGRGHFLSGYDGNENEIRVGKTYYYIYRNN